MKKLLLILMVLGVAAPLFAAGRVQFSVVDNGEGSCTIVWDANSTFAVAPVAMGLTVKVTSGNPIKSVAIEDPCDFMEIYMDAAYSMETDPCCLTPPCYNYGDGTPIADPCGPGEIALPSSHFVISMGGLGGEFAKTKPAPMSGSITLYADTQEAPAGVGGVVIGTIKVDPRRGGVIGEDGVAMETNLEDLAKQPNGKPFQISECLRGDSLSYIRWRGVGHVLGATWRKPRCWCYKKHCRGDSDGVKTGPKRVGLPDLNLFLDAWNLGAAAMTQEFMCADWDHKKTGPKYVALPDLNILLEYFNDGDLTVPVCPTDWDAIPDAVNDFNFWIVINQVTKDPTDFTFEPI